MAIIELNRRFVVGDPPGDEAEFRQPRWDAYSAVEELDWPGVLSHRIVVVLGEAGSGKTKEFELQAKTQVEYGRAAFCVSVAEVADHGLSAALGPEDDERLQGWSRAEDDGLFFLDSVDEAALHHKDFKGALVRFAKEISDNILRSRVFISCRVSDWKPNIDMKIVEDVIGGSFSYFTSRKAGGTATKDQTPGVVVVRLAPLDDDQILALSRENGVDLAEDLLGAIHANNAEAFAARPLDVEWLVRYWSKHGHLGSLNDIIEENIQEKLKERTRSPSNDTSPAPATAREGAEMLAAASTFCQAPTFKILGDSDPNALGSPTEASLDATDLLIGWNRPSTSALLSQALFDEATYGRTRFHHRSIREYLTACWLSNLLNADCPTDRVLDLLFMTQYGTTVAIPALAPVTAWLAGMHSSVLDLALEVAPEIVVGFGDPKTIPVARRSEALRRYSAAYGSKNHLSHHFDWAETARFVEPALSDTISDLLKEYGGQAEPTRLLLTLVEQGRLASCAPAALDVAKDITALPHITLSALKAAAKVGNDTVRKEMVRYVRAQAVQMSPSVLGAIFEAVFPDVLTLEDLAFVISAVPPPPKRGTGRFEQSLRKIIKRICPQELLIPLLRHLTQALNEPPVIMRKEEAQVSMKFEWLLGPTALLAARIVSDLPVADLPIQELGEALDILDRCRLLLDKQTLHQDTNQLGTAFHEVPRAKQVLFWHRAAQTGFMESSDSAPILATFGTHSFLVPDPSDRDWLQDDVLTRTSLAEQLLALDGLAYSRSFDGVRDWLSNHRPSIRNYAVLEETVQRRLRRITTQQAEGRKLQNAEMEQRRLREEKQANDNRIALELRLDEVRDATDFQALRFLCLAMKEKDGGTRSRTDSASLVASYSENVADAARVGLTKFWRTYTPDSPIDMESPNTTTNGIAVGLSGIAIEVEDGLKLSTLSDEDAHTATRYAMHEMNRFPPWLATLGSVKPKIVEAALHHGIEQEFCLDADSPFSPDVLSKLKREEGLLQDLMYPMILRELEAAEPQKLEVLERSIRILLNTTADGNDRERLCHLAAERCRSQQHDLDRFGRWWRCWLESDPNAAASFLQIHVESHPEQAERILLNVAGAFYGMIGRLHEVPPDTFKDTAVLGLLIPLFYEHVTEPPPFSDGGPHAVTPEDNARSMRNDLVSKLTAIPGEETYQRLSQLAADDRIGDARDHFRNLARQHAERFASLSAWTPKDVIDFQTQYDIEPKTREDLYRIALLRLGEVEKEIEGGDSTLRTMFKAKHNERDFQRYIAGMLRSNAKDRYTIGREPEVADQKRIDIRFENPATGPVAVEIKCAHKYSYPVLQDTLQKQLVDRYLQDPES